MFLTKTMYVILGCAVLSLVPVNMANSTEKHQCYECESDTLAEACGDRFVAESVRKVDCLFKPRGLEDYKLTNKCSKIITSAGGMTKISRTCFYQNPNNATDHCMILPFNKHSINYDKCEVCEGNLCNAAKGSTKGSIFHIFLLTIFFSFPSAYILTK